MQRWGGVNRWWNHVFLRGGPLAKKSPPYTFPPVSLFDPLSAMKILPKTILVALACSGLAGCYEVPVTGQKAMILVDDKDVTKMSVAAFAGMKKQYRVSHDRARIEQLNRVGERLSKVVF